MASFGITLVLPKAVDCDVFSSYVTCVPPANVPTLKVRFSSMRFSRNALMIRAAS